MPTDIDALRRFNRAYTARIGALDDSYLGSGRPLGPSRLLFEIEPGGSAVGRLRDRLGFDSGYASRLLRQLEAEGLVTVQPDPADRRQRIVALTDAGHRERRALDTRAEGAADELLAPLSPRLRSELATALATAERLLRAATVRFEVVDVGATPAREALARYFAELDERFRAGFDPGEGGADDDRDAFTPPDGAFVVMTDDDAVIGCGGLTRVDDTTAEIKRMWIDPERRGLGLGLRMVRHLEAEAARSGRTTVILDTNEVLTEAIALYRRAGYRPTDRYNDNPYAHHWFTRSL